MPERKVRLRVRRLKNAIAADPRYGSEQEWTRKFNIHRDTARNALTNGWVRRDVAYAIGEDFGHGKKSRCFIEEEPSVNDATRLASNALRDILIEKIVKGELKERDDKEAKINLLHEAMKLVSHPRVDIYTITLDVGRHACYKLSYEGWAIYHDEEDVYHVNPLDEFDLEPIIKHRIAVEIFQVRQLIAKIRDKKKNPGFHERFNEKLTLAYAHCKAHIKSGHGFRETDHQFHRLMADDVPEIGENIIHMVSAADQVYLRWRQLLASTNGKDSTTYGNKIAEFNRKQCADLGNIRDEFERTQPRVTEIEKMLNDHARRQLDLMKECRDMIEQIKQRKEGQNSVAAALDGLTD